MAGTKANGEMKLDPPDRRIITHYGRLATMAKAVGNEAQQTAAADLAIALTKFAAAFPLPAKKAKSSEKKPTT